MAITKTPTGKPAAGKPEPINASDLVGLGFKPPETETPKRLIASIAGREKSGKTHLALTAPPPIIFFDVDIGTEGVVEKFAVSGKEIYIYTVKAPRPADGKPSKESWDLWAAMWEDAKVKLRKAYGVGHGTIIIDTGGELYELNRLARFGKLSQVLPKDYTDVNNEWREVMRWAYESNMNTIFIHKMKPKWVNSARTSEYEVSGFGDIEYMTQINLRTLGATEDGEFKPKVFIKDCRQNMNVSGTELEGDMCDFQFLIDLVHSR